ncbi:hypothetical protein FRB99_005646 [Tulasnella sp. 403]|nr:hypothetical protein FRB99_005646 [Tulasnella sp. 403]
MLHPNSSNSGNRQSHPVGQADLDYRLQSSASSVFDFPVAPDLRSRDVPAQNQASLQLQQHGNDVAEDGSRSYLVISGGTGCNSIVTAFGANVAYVLPVSDNGGSSSEIIRVIGGPSIGDIRSRLVRLIPEAPPESPTEAIRRLLSHRFSVNMSESQARDEWLDIVQGRSPLWKGIPADRKETIRGFLVYFEGELLRRAQKRFSFRNGSVGNYFLTAAHLFFRSVPSAIFLFSSITGSQAQILPVLVTNHTVTIAAELEDDTRIIGQCEISHPVAQQSTPQFASGAAQAFTLDIDEDEEDENNELNSPVEQNIFFAKGGENEAEAPLESPIRRVFYMNPYGQEIFPPPNPEFLSELASRNTLVYSVGSLWTSIIPCLALKGVASAIARSPSLRAKVLLLNGCNDRETGGYTAVDYVQAITRTLNWHDRRGRSQKGVKSAPFPTLDSLRQGSIEYPTSAFVTHLVYLKGTAIEVDQLALTSLGVNCLAIEPTVQGRLLYDAEVVKLALGKMRIELAGWLGDGGSRFHVTEWLGLFTDISATHLALIFDLSAPPPPALMDVASEIRSAVPETDDIIVKYLNGLYEDADEEHESIMSVTRGLLESFADSDKEAYQELLNRLSEYLEKQLEGKRVSFEPSLTKLDRVMEMNKTTSNTIGLAGGVDLSSVNKGKETRVDLKKLEKQEAKLKAKIDKRAKRVGGPLYEGSKLMEAQKKQQAYEDLFLKVNPLDARASAKGKSKDIHLVNIDVNFGSHRILTGASLTLAYGRRYGLIGRNGVGKSTLLRHIALRELAIPPHITILFVEQEIVGDDTPAIESVLQADVWRDRLLTEERELNEQLNKLETENDGSKMSEEAKEIASTRLMEVHQKLTEIDAETGPARAAALLAGLGFNEADQQRPTRTFSGGWRMRLALARALFVKPDLLMLDEPSNHIDLNALAWLEDYLQTWPSTILVVSHDRAFLDAVATDIVLQRSERLEYFKGNFSQFYATKTERDKNMRKEYEAQKIYREHLQAFIDRWRYNAARAAQAQSKIKILEKLPELEVPESEDTEKFKFPDTEKISPPLLQLNDAKFGYTPDKIILNDINIDVGLDSRIAIVGPNGSGKSTVIKLLIGELKPMAGHVSRNGRLRIGYFAQHHVDGLDPTVSPVRFLQSKFPGKTEQEYRGHLGAFGISGLTGLQTIGTLSGGQKSRVAFAVLSMENPHILLLDEPTNHLDMEGLDALMHALSAWNGGVILISHDERFITNVSKELWVCGDGKVSKYYGDVTSYKKLIVSNLKLRP